MDQSIINFKVYEDSVEYVGMAQATLPDLTALTQSISGAGIAGNVEAVILGHFDAMTLGLNFRTVTAQSVKLSEPRRHTIDLRVAQQDEDVVAGEVVVRAVKHIFVVIPKSDKGGTVAPASRALQRLRRVRRPLLGDLHRRQEGARDRSAEFQVRNQRRRLSGACSHGARHVIHISPGAVFRSGHIFQF